MSAPIFYDASGKRRRWSIRGMFGLLLLAVATAVTFAATVVDLPVPAQLGVAMERPRARPLAEQIHRLRTGIGKLGAWLPHASRGPDIAQVRVGFYVPWDDTSKLSLQQHIGELDWVVPALLSVNGPAHKLVETPDPKYDAILASATTKPKIMPMVQNTVDDKWDGAGTAALLASAPARAQFLGDLEAKLAARKATGVVFDFESLPVSAQHDYIGFVAQARARFAPRGWLVSVTVPAADPDWDLRGFARAADKLFVMNYDEHEPTSQAGPIASQMWFVNNLKRDVALIGASKVIVAVGNYAYDWTEGMPRGETPSTEEAWLIAHDSGSPVRFDPASGNPTFDYEDDNNRRHHVWLLDAVTAWNELRAADVENVAGVALWRLGGEDAGFWDAWAKFETGKLPDLSRLRTAGDVDVEGSGEILHIDATPSEGHRTIKAGPGGLIADETFESFPTPYVVRRTGDHPGLVALTFDDGPDEQWTPKILDILKAKRVSATFFVIGENAITNPGILQRIVDEGNELGNHSYTHPNLARESQRGTMFELNTTQRLIEAYTGRETRLFRAPYFGDAEPTTPDELGPALAAQQAGYINVGLHVDPNDWQRPGAAAIVDRVIAQVLSGGPENAQQIVLLHDGGGDRSETIAALPQIIDQLRARGYKFTSVSQLMGASRDTVMPLVPSGQLMSVRADVGAFLMFAGVLYLIKWLFFVAIALGVVRAVILAALAWRSQVVARRKAPPPIDPAKFISVIIPAFNEAMVIESSVRRVLESTQAEIEVIVVDDGSTDATSEIVSRVFGSEPRVRLLTLSNGGKAHALNRALALAKGEIVVALDADTQFEPETIARLARWFADPQIGAVAGNAMVGNRVNLVTKWQGVEYVTAQNLERRALSRFDAITVVPGAVGAWRRAALDDVGGYPVDTLAEDQDLTIAIQRRGWRIAYDVDAVAWTEAPESFRALAKQRYRWAFGTLQCLWKHGSILRTREPLGLALIGLPQAWLFQIVFALISPVIDLALVVSIAETALRVAQHGWAQTQSDVLRMAVYWIAFTAIDVACGWVAYRMEPREKRYPVLLLVAQRFVYRQLMYSVVIRAVSAALSGLWVGWGKLERSGSVGAAHLAKAS
jgi:peptidoglycan/xylan/chitin deacetylase (PgdA/CDA1 family)/spore germination protein YaaH/GT2 family glycosyltransferase